VGTDSSYRYDLLMLGWEKDQDVSAAVSNLARGIYFYSYGNHYIQYVYENGGSKNIGSKVLYDDLTNYQAKIVLKDAGAQYYLRGGAYDDWQLVHDTTYTFTGDDLLRISIHQNNMDMTINSVSVKHVTALTGAQVDFANAQGDGIVCLSLPTWVGIATTAGATATAPAVAPSLLSATAADGKVELSWTAGTTDETEFQVERDCGAGFIPIGVSLTGITSYSDTTYTDSATCTYQVQAYKAATCPWTTQPSNQAVVIAPPAAPLVSATADNSLKVRLDWTDAADEEGYEIEMQVFNGTWMLVATVEADVLTYTDTSGINPAKTLNYRVRSYRGSVNSAYGEAEVTTPDYVEGDANCPPAQ